jgi:GT2 family glycosyltransferase
LGEKTKIKTAVVILNWNGKKYLEQFLPTVVRHSSESQIQIFVADNGSSDDSVDFLKSQFPLVSLILLDQNYGFSEGYNRALAQIDAEYFVLLNSDVEVTENWISPIIEIMEKDPKIGAAAPKLLAFYNKSQFEYAGAAGGYIDKFGYPFCKGRIISNIETDNAQYDSITEVMWASGACMFVRAELYKKLGGLDNDFFAHMEEIDLCWRMKNIGYSVKNVNTIKVYHVGGGTLPNNNPKKIYLNYRNNLLLLLKNLPKGKLISHIFIRLILDGMSGSVYLISGKFSFFWAVIKAHFSFYARIPKFLKKRKALKPVVSEHPEMYKKSIVMSFFLRNKKTFDQLEF